MSKAVKTCLVCGKEYPACSYCEKQNEYLAWRSVVCCPEHFVFHMPIIQYKRGIIGKEEARAELTAAMGSYDKPEFLLEIKAIVDEIFAENKPKRAKKKITK